MDRTKYIIILLIQCSLLFPSSSFAQVSLDELTRVLTEQEWYFDDFKGDILELYRDGRRKIKFNKDGSFSLQIRCGRPPERHWNIIDNETICIEKTPCKILWLSDDYVKLEKIVE